MSNRSEVRRLLAEFNFRALFTEELGWNTPRTRPVRAPFDDKTLEFGPVAEKAGVVVLHCRVPDGASIPDRAGRVKLYRHISKLHHEHLIVYTNATKTEQEWVWVRDERGKPLAPRTARWRKGGANEDLVQKLQHLAISMDMEEELTAGHVTAGQRRAFDVESAATKKFYDEFKKQHAAFLTLVEGIDDQSHREWYTSVMLNRLMFVYFVQRKGFLDGDVDYLNNRLARLQAVHGRDRFFSFYRFFLLRLFHEGLGGRDHSRELTDLLGTVPYLNGGLFDVHELERRYTDIQISDSAFEAVFAFFGRWHWHLDDRPVRDTGEINPDVLGYIFEKYINQKQMGAYYTREDITEYIGRNTIIPWLFDAARERCKVAFERGGMVWRLLQENPDRYLYPGVKQGVVDEQGNVIELPNAIAEGMENVAARGGRNGPAPEPFALPTETWREYVARRTRTLEVRDRLGRGEVHDINELITLNLNIQLFVEDVIFHSEGPELVRAFWHALAGHLGDVNRSNDDSRPGVAVLDPTCGSGAFLFAALNILRPLYDGCLDRMQSLVDEWKDAGEPGHPQRLREFRDVLARVNDTAQHPNRDYFVLKSIILNNLFGVDIMEEAVEICKLRLFLKLVAQVERDPGRANQGLEPLPDVDFNIRTGNTLVGFATVVGVRRAVEGAGQAELMLGDSPAVLNKIEEDAEQVDLAFQRFREAQTNEGVESIEVRARKGILRERLRVLAETLDRYLAQEYGIDATTKSREFARWKDTHRPFHWFVEFYGTIRRGGFDVIIGNPPYIAAAKVRQKYRLRGYRTENCPDIYAPVLERCVALLSAQGRTGMIVPLSVTFSAGFDALRRLAFEQYGSSWFSSFARIPAALFGGEVRVRNTIHIGSRSGGKGTHGQRKIPRLWTTVLHRWFEEARPYLFTTLAYSPFVAKPYKYLIPKTNTSALASALEAQFGRARGTVAASLSGWQTTHSLHYKKSAYNWLNFCREQPPCYDARGNLIPHTKFGTVSFPDAETRDLAMLFLNGKIMFVFWCIIGDDFDVTRWMFEDFPIEFSTISPFDRRLLLPFAMELDACMRANSSFKLNAGKRVGNYNLARCRHITDKSDLIFAEHLGLLDVWPDIELMYAQVVKTSFSDTEEEEVADRE